MTLSKNQKYDIGIVFAMLWMTVGTLSAILIGINFGGEWKDVLIYIVGLGVCYIGSNVLLAYTLARKDLHTRRLS